MKVCFVTLKSSKNKWAEQAIEEYQEKIGHIVSFEFVSLRSKSLARESQIKKRELEGQKLLDYFEAGDYVVLFSEEGKLHKDSVAFSEALVGFLEQGKSRVVFVVGGPYGFSPEVKSRANTLLSLSPLTMNHFVAQIASLEQIYRALMIWKGRAYHNS